MLLFLSILSLIKIIHFLEVSKAHFYFSFCYFNQNTDKKGRAVAVRQRKMSWQLRALHLSRGICNVASLQYCIDLQDFVKHLTKMEGFKNGMQDIDAIISFKNQDTLVLFQNFLVLNS